MSAWLENDIFLSHFRNNSAVTLAPYKKQMKIFNHFYLGETHGEDKTPWITDLSITI